MKEKTIKDVLENPEHMKISKEWFDTIMDYEKAWLGKHSEATFPIDKFLDYFGVDLICEFYGCKIHTETIARELLYAELKVSRKPFGV